MGWLDDVDSFLRGNVITGGLYGGIADTVGGTFQGWQESYPGGSLFSGDFLGQAQGATDPVVNAIRAKYALGGASGSWGPPMVPEEVPMSYLPVAAGPGVMSPVPYGSGRRSLVPFQGAGSWPGPNYRIANRPYRRGQPERPAGIYWVPRRSMNPLNPRALRRAASRIKAASRWAKTIVTLSRSKAVRGGARKRRKR